MLMKRISLLAIPFLFAGCANALAGFVGESVGIPLEEKVVASKVEPNLLIATDQTSCQVSKGRWEKAEVGERSLCMWAERRLDSMHDAAAPREETFFGPRERQRPR
jgi:hypothetical protein